MERHALILTACLLLPPAAVLAAASSSLYFSPDGKYFAAASRETIDIGTSRDRKLIRSIGKDEDAKKGNWSLLGFTPDSRRLAVYYHWTGELKFLSPAGEVLSAFKAAEPESISRSFKWAVTGSNERGKRKYALAAMSGEVYSPRYLLAGEVSSARFSPGDKMLAYIRDNSDLEVMEIKTGKYLKRYSSTDRKKYGSPEFSPDGRLLAFATGDNKVEVINLSGWKGAGSVSRGGTPVHGIAFSPDMSYMAVNYGGWALRVYSLPDYRVAAKADFEGENEWSINDMAFSLDSSFLAISGFKPSGSAAGRHGVRFVGMKKQESGRAGPGLP